MKKANELSIEQLKNVSGGGSTNEETSNGFRKTCPLCDTFSWCVPPYLIDTFAMIFGSPVA